MSLGSYPKILAFGHRGLRTMYEGNIVVEEKVDGSQFSFGLVGGTYEVGSGEEITYHLECRSKGQQIVLDAADKMFELGIATAKMLKDKLIPGAIYRGEFLNRPKHNTLMYERVPKMFFILFDVERPGQNFMTRAEKEAEAQRLGLEVVPCFYEGPFQGMGEPRKYLENVSILGGQKIEGIVIKNYERFGPEGKIAVAKVVSEEFKEIHQGEWKKSNPAPVDIVTGLIAGLATPARFNKAIQRRKEAGEYLGAPQDIGPLIRSIQDDVKAECAEEIKDALFGYFWSQICRGIVKDFPQWFKTKLLEEMSGEFPRAHEPKDLGQETVIQGVTSLGEVVVEKAFEAQADGVPS